LMVVGGILEVVNERLLELPIVLLGLAWMLLGYSVWSSRAKKAVQHPARVS
jgi:hypothetical protein